MLHIPEIYEGDYFRFPVIYVFGRYPHQIPEILSVTSGFLLFMCSGDTHINSPRY
jgi:hypothetical protein